MHEVQFKIIDYMLRYRQGEVSVIPPVELLSPDDGEDAENLAEEPEERVDFQTAFNNIVKAYRNMPDADSKTSRIRSVISSLSSDDLDQITQLVDSLATLSNKPMPAENAPSLDCSCLDCPARKEVERWNGLSQVVHPFPDLSLAQIAHHLQSQHASFPPNTTAPFSLDGTNTPSLLPSKPNPSSLTPQVHPFGGNSFDWAPGLDPMFLQQLAQRRGSLSSDMLQLFSGSKQDFLNGPMDTSPQTPPGTALEIANSPASAPTQ